MKATAEQERRNEPHRRTATAVVLLSGGMDSAALLHYVHKRLHHAGVHVLSVRYGQKHARELDMAAVQARAGWVLGHDVLDLAFLKDLTGRGSALTDARVAVPDLDALAPEQRDQPSTYVPHRNLMLLSLAAACAEARGIREVFYGAQAQDEYGYWDCTGEFVRRLNAVLALNRRAAVNVKAPFAALSKAAVLEIGLELGVDYAHTWTCYRGADAPCGACPSCRERAAAFRAVGVQDPLIRSGSHG